MLAHWNNSPRVDMSPHLDTLFWFRANQSLLFLLNAACFAEKHQIPIVQSLLWPDRDSNLQSTTLEASTSSHYTTDAVNHPQGYTPIFVYIRDDLLHFKYLYLCDCILILINNVMTTTLNNFKLMLKTFHRRQNETGYSTHCCIKYLTIHGQII